MIAPSKSSLLISYFLRGFYRLRSSLPAILTAMAYSLSLRCAFTETLAQAQRREHPKASDCCCSMAWAKPFQSWTLSPLACGLQCLRRRHCALWCARQAFALDTQRGLSRALCAHEDDAASVHCPVSRLVTKARQVHLNARGRNERRDER